MNYKIVGESSGIGQAVIALMAQRGHARAASGTADVMVFVAGHDYEVCVEMLLEAAEMASARAYVVVTSEHGSVPVGLHFARYAAMKAAQKMVCRTLAHAGIPTVDVSPAFVVDSGKSKRINRDQEYREQVFAECAGTPPVTSAVVASAIVYAAENVGYLTGTTIKVSAGWRA